MVDVHTPTQRSRNMAAIRGKNTTPELVVRKELHKLGFRYRIHYSGLPGKPDLVFPKLKAVIQINGCFWHKHECHLFKWPKSNPDFWKEKIEQTGVRDAANAKELKEMGWRTLILWECALKGKQKQNLENIVHDISKWLSVGKGDLEISGKQAS